MSVSVSELGPAKQDVEPNLNRVRSGRTLHAIKEGWMYKKGGKSFSSFKRRYVILWTNKRIEYYKTDDLKQMQGSVNLMSLSEKKAIQRSDKVPKNKSKETFGFSIATATRTWHFAVRDEQEREQWIYTLRALVIEDAVSVVDAPKKGRLSLIKFPPPPTRRSHEEPETLDQEEEVFSPSVTAASPSVDAPIPVDDAYDPEEVLMKLQAEYDEKHNPQRNGKTAHFVDWSHDDGDQNSSESLNSSEHEDGDKANLNKNDNEDPDIDTDYDWNASMTKVKAKALATITTTSSTKQDSLHDSEDEEEEDDDQQQQRDTETPLSERRRQFDVAQYQSAVYGNEQPMHQHNRKESERAQRKESRIQSQSLQSQSQQQQHPLSPPESVRSAFSPQSERRIIDWDEDDFDGDSISDETEEDEESDEKEYAPKMTPSTKQENLSYLHLTQMNGQNVSFKEEEYVSSSHFTLRLFYPLKEYMEWTSRIGDGDSDSNKGKLKNNGKGMRIERVKRNKHGKKLYIKYGFESHEQWFCTAINGQSVSEALKKDIDALLMAVDLKDGYTVTLKKKKKEIKKMKKKKSMKMEKTSNSKGKSAKTTKSKTVRSPKRKSVKSPKSQSRSKSASRSKSSKSPKSPSTSSRSKKSSTKSPKSKSSTSSRSSVKRKNGKMENDKERSSSNSKTKKRTKQTNLRNSESASNGMNGKVVRPRKVLKV